MHMKTRLYTKYSWFSWCTWKHGCTQNIRDSAGVHENTVAHKLFEIQVMNIKTRLYIKYSWPIHVHDNIVLNVRKGLKPGVEGTEGLKTSSWRFGRTGNIVLEVRKRSKPGFRGSEGRKTSFWRFGRAWNLVLKVHKRFKPGLEVRKDWKHRFGGSEVL